MFPKMVFARAALVILGLCALASAGSAAGADRERRVLVFSKTTGFRHDSIPDGIAAIRALGEQRGFAVDESEDATVFSDSGLAPYSALVFLNTTGNILNDNQKAAFQRYIQGGGGFVGIHSASDTEHNWPWYGALVGAFFQSHPSIQQARIRVADRVHASTRFLPSPWTRTDEWYNFDANPRSRVHVLATVDESTYAGGEMGSDHPIAWCQFYEGGRSWYTAGGHTRESFSEPLFLQHLLGGIQFAAGFPDGDCRSPRPIAPRLSRGKNLSRFKEESCTSSVYSASRGF